MEKRVRKDARINHPLKRGEKVCLLTNETKESAVSSWFFERMTKTLNVTTEQRPLEQKGDLSVFNKVFYPFDADDIVGSFLEHIFSKGVNVSSQPLSLVGGLLDSEIKTFADLRQLSYKEVSETGVAQSLQSLEKLYPGSTFGLAKSKKQLE